jgi:hypothetical protein
MIRLANEALKVLSLAMLFGSVRVILVITGGASVVSSLQDMK